MWVKHTHLLTRIWPLLGPSFGLLHSLLLHSQLQTHGVIDLKTLIPITGFLQIITTKCKEVLLIKAIPKLGQVLQTCQHKATTVLRILHLTKALPWTTQPAFTATPTAILHPSKLHQIKIQVHHISPLFRIQSVILLLLLLVLLLL